MAVAGLLSPKQCQGHGISKVGWSSNEEAKYSTAVGNLALETHRGTGYHHRGRALDALGEQGLLQVSKQKMVVFEVIPSGPSHYLILPHMTWRNTGYIIQYFSIFVF